MAHIEYHPENGRSPHVIVFDKTKGGLWLAYASREEAEQHLPTAEVFDGDQWTPEQIAAIKSTKLPVVRNEQ